MSQYVTGAAIKKLRERKGLKQSELAERMAVSDKAVSKWETGRGYPDITLLGPLAQALDVSVAELISGCTVENTNVSANMTRCKFYVCPMCGNIITSTGEASISCHGTSLSPLAAEEPDNGHVINVSLSDGELYVCVEHPMTKGHFISFIAAVSPGRVQLAKTYPESCPDARFNPDCVTAVYAYCNKDGLFKVRP